MTTPDTVEVDAETMKKLLKLTKAELIEKFVSAALEARVAGDRCQTAIEAERAAQGEVKRLERDLASVRSSLRKAESYVEQGRTMIEAIMEKWYDYED